MSAEVRQIMGDLEDRRRELGRLSDALAELMRKSEPLDVEWDDFLILFKASMWHKAESKQISRLPSADMMQTLAHEAFEDKDLLGRRRGMHLSRERLRKRIDDLVKEVGALRSLLSAEKAIQEGGG